jgi:hypothetical protein
VKDDLHGIPVLNLPLDERVSDEMLLQQTLTVAGAHYILAGERPKYGKSEMVNAFGLLIGGDDPAGYIAEGRKRAENGSPLLREFYRAVEDLRKNNADPISTLLTNGVKQLKKDARFAPYTAPVAPQVADLWTGAREEAIPWSLPQRPKPKAPEPLSSINEGPGGTN